MIATNCHCRRSQWYHEAVALLLVWSLLVADASGHYLNQWAVELDGGDQAADRVARELGCINLGKIVDNAYLFSHPRVSKRSVSSHAAAQLDIAAHPEVTDAWQQKTLSRTKRQFAWRLKPSSSQQRQNPVPDHYDDALHFDDPRWPQMWYLNRGDRLDMNVQEAWMEGATGKGISVTILDDGIEHTHPDLRDNYDPMASYDVNENDGDPTPRYDIMNSNRHGTRCAGEVAATANNSNCAVGIAFEAGIGGVRMLDGDVTDAVEARSLGLNNQHISIYSASWGPDDDGKTVDGPGKLASRAFLQGITKGRNGKGNVFVWASGNGGRDHDNCNCDGYTNSIWTLSISSATEHGLIPWYSEACASTLASTYSSGSAGERKVVTTDLRQICTSSHTGTSASAPLAAGIIALCLQVNPELSWRDAQHLTVRCAHNANLKANDWSVNAVGRNFSHSFGYGIMDASCMVRLARKWKPVPAQQKCTRLANRLDLIVPSKTVSKTTLDVKGCAQEGPKVLEHVQARVTLAASKRGDVIIVLVSPSGTRSNLVAKRPRDYSRDGFNDWPFLTVHMWDENPDGTWTLEIQNDGRSIVELKHWRLVFYGTEEDVNSDLKPWTVAPTKEEDRPAVATSKPTESEDIDHQLPPAPEPLGAGPKEPVVHENCLDQKTSDWCNRCAPGFLQHFGRCVAECPKEGYFEGEANRAKACRKCYYSCKTCHGPNDYECLSCYGDAELESETSTRHYCYNKSLVEKIFSSSRWYYFLSVGFLANFCMVVILVVYITRWRKSRQESSSILPRVNGGYKSGGAMLNGRIGGGVRGMNSAKRSSKGAAAATTTIPFHDYSSSDDEELLRKPYTDEVAS